MLKPIHYAGKPENSTIKKIAKIDTLSAKKT